MSALFCDTGGLYAMRNQSTFSFGKDTPHDPEKKFRAFLEAAPDAIVVIDREGIIVIVNTLTEKMFGYSREELLGHPVEILVPNRYRSVHMQHRKGYFHDPKTRPMGEGQALRGRKKDGTEFPVEISLSPLVSDEGTLVTSIIRDIGPRQQLEAKFRGLLESAPDGIVVVNSAGIIVIVNNQTEKMFDYNKDELLNQPVEILVPSSVQNRHVALRNGYISNPKTRPMGAGTALTGRKKDGSEFPVEISLSPLETEQGTLITSIIRDITDRRKAEELIQESLLEKEALLKEIHHRVKNNLQITSSLLRLQSGYIEDEKALEMFSESQNRIRSMALVHEKLYQSKDLSRIDFSDYVQTLADLLFRSFGVDREQIHLSVESEKVFLSVEIAVPCGLMINELISNCLKHAFPGKSRGNIRVLVRRNAQNQVTLAISDDGVGFPKDLRVDAADTLGLQLVHTLTEQLNGKLNVVSQSPGTLIEVTFIEAPGSHDG